MRPLAISADSGERVKSGTRAFARVHIAVALGRTLDKDPMVANEIAKKGLDTLSKIEGSDNASRLVQQALDIPQPLDRQLLRAG